MTRTIRGAFGGIAGRIALAVVLALVAAQAITFTMLWFMRPDEPRFFSVRWVAEQVASAAELAYRVPPAQRRAALAGHEENEWLAFDWRTDPGVWRDDAGGWQFRQLREALAVALRVRPSDIVVARGGYAPRLTPGGPRRGPRRAVDSETAAEGPLANFDAAIPASFTIVVRGPDGTFLTAAPREPYLAWRFATVGLWLLSIGAAIALLSIWAARRLVLPLDSLSHAVVRLGVDRDAPPAPEAGPAELRSIARAVNEMNGRLRRFVDDRTQMVAAVSHDLRTPLTRMRLRAEYIGDPEQRDKMLADIAEMEAMVAETLEFASADASREKRGPTDVAALLASICADLADSGREAQYDGPDHAVLTCQPTALKRAFNNLIENAVAHGSRARVRLADRGANVEVAVADDGPGIPEEELEKVFQPFYRLERSRNRAFGGTGLGLAVARTIVRGHGGDVTLANAPAGGLIATVTLPRTSAT